MAHAVEDNKKNLININTFGQFIFTAILFPNIIRKLIMLNLKQLIIIINNEFLILSSFYAYLHNAIPPIITIISSNPNSLWRDSKFS